MGQVNFIFFGGGKENVSVIDQNGLVVARLVICLLLGSMISRADENEAFAKYARPGGWNG